MRTTAIYFEVQILDNFYCVSIALTHIYFTLSLLTSSLLSHWDSRFLYKSWMHGFIKGVFYVINDIKSGVHASKTNVRSLEIIHWISKVCLQCKSDKCTMTSKWQCAVYPITPKIPRPVWGISPKQRVKSKQWQNCCFGLPLYILDTVLWSCIVSQIRL